MSFARDTATTLALLKIVEGVKLKAYRDTGGVPTIGIGTTKYPNGHAVRIGDSCTAAQAVEYCTHDLVTIRFPALEHLVKVPLNGNEEAALTSFIYNVGVSQFEESTLLKKLNAGRPKAEVAHEFSRWTVDNGRLVAGLVKRRAAESYLFLKPVKKV